MPAVTSSDMIKNPEQNVITENQGSMLSGRVYFTTVSRERTSKKPFFS
jgi:hypothetical protein